MADREIRELEGVPARLALPEAGVANAAASIRAYHTQRSVFVEQIVPAILLTSLLLFFLVAYDALNSIKPIFTGGDIIPLPLDAYVCLVGIPPLWVAVIWLVWRTPTGGVTVLHRLTVRTARAAVLCASIREQPRSERFSRLRALDRRCREIERDLMDAHRTVRTMATSSPRHVAAQQHAAQVAGALRQDLVRLDSEPDIALCDLARKLIIVGEQYAKGLVSALLPPEVLQDVVPLSATRERRKESLRLVLAVLAALACALAVQPLLPRLGVAGNMQGWCVATAAFIPFVLIVDVRRALSYMGVWPA